MIIGTVFADALLVTVSVVHFLKLNQHFRSSFDVFFELRCFHILGRTIGIHTVFTHFITFIRLFNLLWSLLLLLLNELLMLILLNLN